MPSSALFGFAFDLFRDGWAMKAIPVPVTTSRGRDVTFQENRSANRLHRSDAVVKGINRVADYTAVTFGCGPSRALRYTPTVHNEHAFIAAFVRRKKRDRYREFISNPRLRHKFTSQLAHFTDFDPKYRLSIPSNKLFVDSIALELKKRNSPSIVFAISEDPALDQKQLPLLEALPQIVGRGMGTVLSCVPGRLAFVETEDERFILERHDPLEKREYIRFVIGRKDEDSHVEQGIFQAVARALEWQNITGFDAEELNDLLAWFNKNLEKPTSFGRDKLRLGVCWFKTDATEHISRIWQIVHILERNDIYVRKIRTDKPGYVIYQDQWQLVAEPFRKATMTR